MTAEEKDDIYDEYRQLRSKQSYERLSDEEYLRLYELQKIINVIDEEDFRNSLCEDRDKIRKEMSKLNTKVEARKRLGLPVDFGMNPRGYYNHII